MRVRQLGVFRRCVVLLVFSVDSFIGVSAAILVFLIDRFRTGLIGTITSRSG